MPGADDGDTLFASEGQEECIGDGGLEDMVGEAAEVDAAQRPAGRAQEAEGRDGKRPLKPEGANTFTG